MPGIPSHDNSELCKNRLNERHLFSGYHETKAPKGLNIKWEFGDEWGTDKSTERGNEENEQKRKKRENIIL